MNSNVSPAPARRAFFLRLCAAVAVVASPTGASSTAIAAASSPARRATLLVLGDSISAGYGLARDAGWVRLLDARLREQHYAYDIVNASISGETTSGGRSRVDELIARVKPAVVIVELGGNDALRGLPLAESEKNLGAIVASAQAAHAAVLLVGMQVPPNYGRSYGDRFAAIYTSTARRYKTALVPFFFQGFAEQLDLFQPDRIHPTAAAQVRLLDNVWPDLEPLLKRR